MRAERVQDLGPLVKCETCKGGGWVACPCERCQGRRCSVLGRDHLDTTCWDCHGRGKLPLGASWREQVA